VLGGLPPEAAALRDEVSHLLPRRGAAGGGRIATRTAAPAAARSRAFVTARARAT